MFSLKDTLANRRLPQRYNVGMGISVLCGHRPVSITCLRSSPCPESVVVHFKSLLAINDDVQQYIREQFIAMQRLFAEGRVAILPGTTEDLSTDPNLQALLDLNVGNCLLGLPTQDQNALFGNRNGVGSNDIVVYIVSTLIDAAGAGNVLGCAVHPSGQPGVAVIQTDDTWLVAHEVAHVLGLRHVCEFPNTSNPNPKVKCVSGSGQSDSLLFPTVGWTNTPPNLSDDEYSTMQNSSLTNPC